MYCEHCGAQISGAFCSQCGERSPASHPSTLPEGIRSRSEDPGPSGSDSRSGLGVTLGILGLLVGAAIGYLVRPSVFLVGQLPFETVITRGGNLSGLDQLLVGAAQTSFNYMVGGAILCGAAGWVAGSIISKR